MEKLDIKDYDPALPARMEVAVVMEKRPSSHPWAQYSYDAVGVVVRAAGGTEGSSRIFADDGVEQYLVSGLSLRLYPDECESYYHNLMSPQPGCYVVADQPDDASRMPTPLLVSLSFDEAHAYLEGDRQVYSVPIPPELYRWSEAYVLTHYVAEKKVKRKRKNWSEARPPRGEKP